MQADACSVYEVVRMASVPAGSSPGVAALQTGWAFAVAPEQGGSSLGAAAAGLSLIQQAAAMGPAGLQVSAADSAAAASPLALAGAQAFGQDGLAKTLSAEAGVPVTLLQQEGTAAAAAVTYTLLKQQQSAASGFSSLSTRCEVLPALCSKLACRAGQGVQQAACCDSN